MRVICLIGAAILWFLHGIGVRGDDFSMVWVGASLIVLGFALDGATLPAWRKPPS